jgi:glycosyltransferase involved in cell wall biosynthesis
VTETRPLPATAIVHDYFAQSGGAERVAIEFSRMFPRSSVFTSVFDTEVFGSSIDRDRVRAWPDRLSHLVAPRFRAFAPAYAAYFDQLRPRRDADGRRIKLLISSSSAFAKAARAPSGAIHVAYVYSPMRFAWDTAGYLKGGHQSSLARMALTLNAPLLRAWDRASARRPDIVIAISETIRDRIRATWGRDAVVVYPPVDIAEFGAPSEPAGEYYLVAARLLAYRRIADVVEACTRLGRPLTVIGDGPEAPHLRTIAGPTITFLGRVDRPTLIRVMRGCRAYIVPGVEDFGIAPVEAMAAGRPVVALGRGGVAETVIDSQTGVLYPMPGSDGLAEAILRFESLDFDVPLIRDRASVFSSDAFRGRFLEIISDRGLL